MKLFKEILFLLTPAICLIGIGCWLAQVPKPHNQGPFWGEFKTDCTPAMDLDDCGESFAALLKQHPHARMLKVSGAYNYFQSARGTVIEYDRFIGHLNIGSFYRSEGMEGWNWNSYDKVDDKMVLQYAAGKRIEDV